MFVQRCFRVLWFEQANQRWRLFEREEEALAFAAERERPLDPETLTLGEFVDEVWLPLRSRGGGKRHGAGEPIAAQTRASYTLTLRKYVLPQFGDHPLRSLGTDDLARALAAIRKQLVASPLTLSSANQHLRQSWGLLASICRVAARLGLARVSMPQRPAEIADEERTEAAPASLAAPPHSP
jgi:hypothetical protein